MLDAAGLDGEEGVKAPDGSEMPLRLALLQKFDLKPFLSDWPQKAASPAEFVAPLRKLQPRLYSISSSPKAHPGEVHLTVAIVRYEFNGRSRKASPVGQITPAQMFQIADLADNYGSGEIRLTVWQNFIIPNIPEAYRTRAAA